jgi:hypothetical protein
MAQVIADTMMYTCVAVIVLGVVFSCVRGYLARRVKRQRTSTCIRK